MEGALLRSVGLWRTVLRRMRADWPVVAAAWVLLVCATTLLTGGALYGDTVALSGLRAAIAAAPAADRSLVVTTEAQAAKGLALDETIRAELDHVIALPGGIVAGITTSVPFADASTDPATVTQLTEFSSYEGIADHASLVDGHWAAAGATPQEATLSEAAASRLNLGVGDRISLVSRLQASLRIDVLVTGIFRPAAADPYWLNPDLEIGGSLTQGSYTTIGPFVVPAADLANRPFGERISFEWRGLPDPDGYQVDDVAAIRLAADQLDERLKVVLPVNTQFRVTTALPKILATIDRSVLVSRTGVLLLVVQYAVLALYAIVLVAGMLADRRRAETATFRTRGASTGHLVAMGVLEAVLLTATAAALAPFLAQLAVRWLVAAQPLAGGLVTDPGVSRGSLLVDGASAVVGILALSLPLLGGGPNLAGVRAAIARQTGSTLARRLGLDLALVVVAAIALWQLRQYGAPITRNARGVLGIDPLLVAAPAIGLLAGAVIATRLLPRVMELLQGSFERGRGLVAAMSGRGLARRPLRYTRSALLLMLAASLGTFAVAHVATWTRSQADQAAYQAGAAVRVMPSRTVVRSPALATALASIPGVSAVMPVDRLSVDAGREVRDDPLLAVDAGSAAGIVNSMPGEDRAATAALFNDLVAARPAPVGLQIPAATAALGIVVDAAFIADVPEDVQMSRPDLATTPGITAAVVVEDGNGRFFRLQAGSSGVLLGAGQRLVVDLGSAVAGTAMTAPLRLRSVELGFTAPPNVNLVGTADLVEVDATADTTAAGTTASTSWQALALTPATGGWSWLSRFGGSGTFDRFKPPAGTWQLQFGGAGGPLPPLFGGFAQQLNVFLRATPPSTTAPVAAIASRAFLEQTGAVVGDTVTATLEGTPSSIQVVGVVEAFPSVDPAKPFIVIDQRTLAGLRLAASGDIPPPPSEWWIATTQPSAVQDAILAGPDPNATIVTTAGQAAALLGDPIPRGVIGVLGLGSWAALIFAAIGFIVSATVSTRERLGEFALLRALGLSGRQLSVWLALEHTFLLVTGILAGILLGILLAWLVLPFATLTASGAAVVPPPVVIIPWVSLLPIVGGAVAVLGATLLVLRGQLLGIRIGDVLRGRDE